MPDKSDHKWDDHNLLIRLDQKVTDLQKAVKDMNDGTITDIVALKKDKADRKDVEELQRVINDKVRNQLEYLISYKGAIMTNATLMWGAWGILLAVLIYHIFGTSK